MATTPDPAPAGAGGGMSDGAARAAAGRHPAWRPERPRLRPALLVVSWVLGAAALMVAAALLPGVHIPGFWGAMLAALLIAVLNALLPPLIAALRVPYTVGLSFVLVLLIDALLLELVADIAPDAIQVDNFGWALLTALLASAVGMVLEVLAGTN